MKFVVLKVKLLMALVVTLNVALTPDAQAKSRIQSLDDITTGQMLVQTDKDAFLLPLIDTQVQMQINGLIARVEVKQFFENTSTEVIEARYLFPLPEDSAVDRMTMIVGDRMIVGQIKEKAEAKRTYEQAVREGKKAALLDQSRDNLFSNKVANIQPGEVIEVRIGYLQTVQYQQGTFSLRFPSTLTPRYQSPPTEVLQEQFSAEAKSVQWQPDASISSPTVDASERSDHQLSIDVSLNAGLGIDDINSPYHGIATFKQAEGRYNIRLQQYSVADRDFELRWTLKSANQPRLLSFHEVDPSEPNTVYTQLLLLPPSQDSFTPLARDVTFIIDQSGSMEGDSMTQAKLALTQAIRELTDQDLFNVIAFNHEFRNLFGQTVPVDDGTRGWATAFVNDLQADGGTEMLPALESALNETTASSRVRQIIFLTDGAVGYESELFQLIHKRLGDARLFTVGIGSAPNSYFMRKAAEFGRGSFTQIGSVSEVSTKMSGLFKQLRYPAMRDISADWTDIVEVYPQALPDLYQGQPLSLRIKRNNVDSKVLIKGQIGNLAWQADVALAGEPTQLADGVGALWARAKITDLMDLQMLNGNDDAIKAEVTELAIQHQLLSPYTSFVAVEQRISRNPEQDLKRANIPNLNPAGTQVMSYPSTALGWQMQFIIGLVLVFLAGLSSWFNRQRECA